MIYYIFYCISTIIMYILHYYISYCLLDFIPDLIIYWILYWIIGGFYQKCVYFVKIGSKTRTGFSLDFVLDNWWVFVKHKIYQILCKIHQISSPSVRGPSCSTLTPCDPGVYSNKYHSLQFCGKFCNCFPYVTKPLRNR